MGDMITGFVSESPNWKKEMRQKYFKAPIRNTTQTTPEGILEDATYWAEPDIESWIDKDYLERVRLHDQPKIHRKSWIWNEDSV